MDSDEALFARVQRGDMRAFDVLYERYERRLFGFLRAQTGSTEDAEEVFHEAFLRTLKSTDLRFEDASPADGNRPTFAAWLFRVARNLVLNRARSSTRGARALAQIALGDPAAQPERPHRADEAMERHEMRVALDAAVAGLPSSLAEVYHLRCSGLSYEQMAEVLDIPLGTIKSRMHQMVATLREGLKSWTAR